jgi:ubiquinone/menaquinone biosynthesis C-methylase UbiE
LTNEANLTPSAEDDAVAHCPLQGICDYEGSSYETDFWIGQNRDYEDRVERIALGRLLPPQGYTLIDIGAGFGRLVDLYSGYEQVILVDYSRSMLRQAQERLGNTDSRYIYVAASVYSLPFADAIANSVVMIRVIHHLTDAPSALSELARITRPDGHLILEFANKCNIKAILRYLLRRQDWSPFDENPIEFLALNYNFHPRWIEHELQKVNLEIQQRLSVSHFRIPFLKKSVPLPILVGMDGAIQPTGRWWLLSPSVFLKVQQLGQTQPHPKSLFRCPACEGPDLIHGENCLECTSCGKRWGVSDGLYDFKESL